MAAIRLGVGLVNIRWPTTPPIWASLSLASRCPSTAGRAICPDHLTSFATKAELTLHVATGDHNQLFFECVTHGPEALEKT
jgi:hypothetical protein